MASVRWIRNENGRLVAVWTARDGSKLSRSVVAAILPVRNVSNFCRHERRSLQEAA
jgi:hypothetical protein